MKPMNFTKKLVLVVCSMILLANFASAQRRYNHLKRVKVDVHYSDQTNDKSPMVKTGNVTNTVVETSVLDQVAQEPVIVTPVVTEPSDVVVTASSDENVVIVTPKQHSKIKNNTKVV